MLGRNRGVVKVAALPLAAGVTINPGVFCSTTSVELVPFGIVDRIDLLGSFCSPTLPVFSSVSPGLLDRNSSTIAMSGAEGVSDNVSQPTVGALVCELLALNTFGVEVVVLDETGEGMSSTLR